MRKPSEHFNNRELEDMRGAGVRGIRINLASKGSTATLDSARCAAAVNRSWMLPALLALTAPLAMDAAHAAVSAWKPDKAVELIAANAPGGGGDRILRIMAKVLQEQRQLEVPITVVNKPGGGNSVAYAYLNQHPGNGHHVAMANKSLLTNNIVGLGPSYTEFTPVATLFNEYIAVTVKPDSPVKSGRDLLERLKKDPGSLSFGIATSLGNPNHQGAAAALKEAGIDVKKVRTVIFPSGGAATTAMLGGHIDVVPITAGLAASMLRNGQLRLDAVTSPRRLPDVLADVPTWREQGYDAVVSSWRSIIGPKGMTEAQIAYWEGILRRMSDSEEWKKELETNFWSSEYMGSVETRKYIERDSVQTRAFLVDLGLAK
ncbi:MAG: hypothetical protein A3F74_05280 [Betaproteobacteria bacterium RIFCSPLOWO2_12_FULL_62_58]|nr:MAG: hypothetical protein A3F74_05280 [Betaproteobacteria bacterium RIFCSPLOWO2_12_FULL_62_58]